MSIVEDLRGMECRCEFDLPHCDWPFPGSPAWVIILDADMGMIKMQSRNGGDAMWVNASKIKTLRIA